MQQNVLKEKLISESEGFSYVVYEAPRAEGEKLPLIVFLHGAGERGDADFNLVKVHGIPKIFDKEVNYRCIAVSPQCPADSFWVAELPHLKIFIDRMIEKYHADPDRVILTGISMGGFGTWYMALRYPEMFAAIVPVCGGGMPWAAGVLKMPIWAFHGDCDTCVAPSNTLDMMEQIKKVNPGAKVTMLHNVGHNAWDYSYKDEVIRWMLEQKRG